MRIVCADIASTFGDKWTNPPDLESTAKTSRPRLAAER